MTELAKGRPLGWTVIGQEDLVRPERFELPTYCSGGNRSIHLSYGRSAVNYMTVYVRRRGLPCDLRFLCSRT